MPKKKTSGNPTLEYIDALRTDVGTSIEAVQQLVTIEEEREQPNMEYLRTLNLARNDMEQARMWLEKSREITLEMQGLYAKEEAGDGVQDADEGHATEKDAQDAKEK